MPQRTPPGHSCLSPLPGGWVEQQHAQHTMLHKHYQYPILQMRKLRPKEVQKKHSSKHRTSKFGLCSGAQLESRRPQEAIPVPQHPSMSWRRVGIYVKSFAARMFGLTGVPDPTVALKQLYPLAPGPLSTTDLWLHYWSLAVSSETRRKRPRGTPRGSILLTPTLPQGRGRALQLLWGRGLGGRWPCRKCLPEAQSSPTSWEWPLGDFQGSQCGRREWSGSGATPPQLPCPQICPVLVLSLPSSHPDTNPTFMAQVRRPYPSRAPRSFHYTTQFQTLLIYKMG